MAARANLILQDRAATPLTRTFSPAGMDPNGVHVFTEKTAIPIANSQYTARISKGKSAYNVTLRLAMPVVQTQTINGVSSPVTLRTNYIEVKASVSLTSTDQERKDLVGIMAYSLNTGVGMINDMLVNVTDIY